MSVYNRGRPRKVNYEKPADIPNKPGEYRIRDKATRSPLYIGETNDLRRRAKEHKKTGKFGPGTYLEYMVANTSTSEERRRHEQQSIKKHSPRLNKSRGGEGRPAKVSSPISADRVTSSVKSKRKRRFVWPLLFVFLIALVLIMVYLLK